MGENGVIIRFLPGVLGDPSPANRSVGFDDEDGPLRHRVPGDHEIVQGYTPCMDRFSVHIGKEWEADVVRRGKSGV